MENFINKGNDGFISVCNTKFVDKSLLIERVNNLIETENRYMCVTRARRFGKSVAIKMLNAYYDESCDSARLFEGLNISKSADYRKHLNHYPVIYLDMTDFITKYGNVKTLVKMIKQDVMSELLSLHPDITTKKNDDLMDVLVKVQPTLLRFLALQKRKRRRCARMRIWTSQK